MDTMEIIKRAIELRKPVRFEYSKAGKIPGGRIGNPHALFIFTSKANIQSIKAHLVQTEGVSDSREPFPSFRTFDVRYVLNVEILTEYESFQPHEDYNPEWDGYKNFIAKI